MGRFNKHTPFDFRGQDSLFNKLSEERGVSSEQDAGRGCRGILRGVPSSREGAQSKSCATVPERLREGWRVYRFARFRSIVKIPAGAYARSGPEEGVM